MTFLIVQVDITLDNLQVGGLIVPIQLEAEC